LPSDGFASRGRPALSRSDAQQPDAEMVSAGLSLVVYVIVPEGHAGQQGR